ncbi:hypothetical protein [Marinobacter nauticus]|uniref:hypothetical protein n=1 Tax=Marinobacter nauticus TaxID=2743 RepID=UPI001C99D353|nr:hypothetical protein [Marinobacter nauticus]MBY5963761.1 hypothetical protein [Marinobacter nauticus]
MSQNDTFMLPHLVDIDALTRQASHLDSMVAMLHLYFDSVTEGGDKISPELLSGYLWQMQHTIFELKDTIQQAAENHVLPDQVKSERTADH